MMQWENKRKIFNVKNNLGDKTNELGNHNKKHKNKKQAEMDPCMNKEQQVPENQQSAKAAIEHAKEQ